MEISANTVVCAVIGDPVGHSLSPQIHNRAFAALDLDCAYVAFHVRRGETANAMAGMRAFGLRGLSVTIPHKVEIIEHLDDIDPVARAVGSVNTVVNEGGRLRGYSTDGPGALRALETAEVEPAGQRVLILGSGGAARAVAFSLASLQPPPRFELLGVEHDEVAELARDLSARTEVSIASAELDEHTLGGAMGRADLVVHATPVGMTPDSEETLVPAELIRPEQVIFDVVYTPLRTRLLREAEERGAVTVAGLGMFVGQAAIQFELWTGEDAPVDEMTQAAIEALEPGE